MALVLRGSCLWNGTFVDVAGRSVKRMRRNTVVRTFNLDSNSYKEARSSRNLKKGLIEARNTLGYL